MSSHYLSGVKDTTPLVLAAMPFGLVFGALGQANQLPEWLILGMSVFVFAGASQFIAVSLMATAAAPWVIILTVFIVNLRHMLYAISLLPLVKGLSFRSRSLMSFPLTDETFAVVINRMRPPVAPEQFKAYYIGSAVFMYLNWILCTWVGMLAGQQLPQVTEFGLDVAMVVAFVAIVVPQLNLPSKWLCAKVAGVLAVLTFHWPHKTGLLFSSLIAIACGVWAENKINKEAK